MAQQKVDKIRATESSVSNQAPRNAIADPHEMEVDEHSQELNRQDLVRVLFVAVAAGAMWLERGSSLSYVKYIGAICALAGGYPIYHEAYENIVQRRMTMELSMAIAIVAALAIRETFTALVITLFVLAAEILEGLTVGRGRNAIQLRFRPAPVPAARFRSFRALRSRLR